MDRVLNSCTTITPILCLEDKKTIEQSFPEIMGTNRETGDRD